MCLLFSPCSERRVASFGMSICCWHEYTLFKQDEKYSFLGAILFHMLLLYNVRQSSDASSVRDQQRLRSNDRSIRAAQSGGLGGLVRRRPILTGRKNGFKIRPNRLSRQQGWSTSETTHIQSYWTWTIIDICKFNLVQKHKIYQIMSLFTENRQCYGEWKWGMSISPPRTVPKLLRSWPGGGPAEMSGRWLTQKSELFKYLKTTFSPHVRRLHAHNLRSKTRSLLKWLVSDFDSSTCQLRKMISQSFGPVGDSSAGWLVWNLTASIIFL